MKKKTTKSYRCRYRQYSIPLKVGGKETRVDFDGGVRMGAYSHGGGLLTSDAELQAAIEGSRAFRRGDIWVERHFEASPLDEETRQQPVYDFIQGVRNQQQAEEYLREHGEAISPGTLKAEEVARKARSLRVAFPEWAVYNKLYPS